MINSDCSIFAVTLITGGAKEKDVFVTFFACSVLGWREKTHKADGGQTKNNWGGGGEKKKHTSQEHFTSNTRLFVSTERSLRG